MKTLKVKRVRDSLNFVVFETLDTFTKTNQRGEKSEVPAIAGRNIHIAPEFVPDCKAGDVLTLTFSKVK